MYIGRCVWLVLRFGSFLPSNNASWHTRNLLSNIDLDPQLHILPSHELSESIGPSGYNRRIQEFTDSVKCLYRFQIRRSATEFYTAHSVLALVGLAINCYTALKKALRVIVRRHGIPNIDLIRAHVGQLCLGKSDFDAIENKRWDWALGIKQMPSASHLRQHFDEDARVLIDCVDDSAMEVVLNTQAQVTSLSTGHVALDMDVFPMDNSGIAKDGFSRAYNGHNGYAPITGYPGRESWCIACELREGQQHSQSEFVDVLERTIPYAR